MPTLKDVREAAGLTQVQLAERAGLTQQVISSLEGGRIRRPSWHVVAKLSQALGVAPQELFNRELAS